LREYKLEKPSLLAIRETIWATRGLQLNNTFAPELCRCNSNDKVLPSIRPIVDVARGPRVRSSEGASIWTIGNSKVRIGVTADVPNFVIGGRFRGGFSSGLDIDST